MSKLPDTTVETFFAVFKDPEVNNLYVQYLEASKNTDCSVQSLGDVVTNVSHGERKGYPLLDCVKGCLEAMVFTRSTPLDEQIEMAEKDFSERYETMTPEQQKVCDRYKL